MNKNELDKKTFNQAMTDLVVMLKTKQGTERREVFGMISQMMEGYVSKQELSRLLEELEKTCDYCDGKGYTEVGGMAMEDDLVEKEPCEESIHDALNKLRKALGINDE